MKNKLIIYILIPILGTALDSCQNENTSTNVQEEKYQTEFYNNQESGDSEMNPILKIAEDHLTNENYTEAIKKFEESDSIYGINRVSLSDKALCYTKLGKYKKSLELNTDYVERYPDDPSGWSNRGMVYIRLEKYQMALADFNKSIEIDPKEAGLYYNRHFAYLNLRNENKACEDLKKALDLGYTEKYDLDALNRYTEHCQ
jgi:tetratricopeptide (TPR) repeat protein